MQGYNVSGDLEPNTKSNSKEEPIIVIMAYISWEQEQVYPILASHENRSHKVTQCNKANESKGPKITLALKTRARAGSHTFVLHVYGDEMVRNACKDAT